jgi:hypothetical protein
MPRKPTITVELSAPLPVEADLGAKPNGHTTPPTRTIAAKVKSNLKPKKASAPRRSPSPPAKPKAERPKGAGYYIRRATIAAFPEVATVAVIEAALADAGIRGTKRSTIDTFRTDCLSVLRIAAEMGRLAERRTREASPKKDANERTEEAA